MKNISKNKSFKSISWTACIYWPRAWRGGRIYYKINKNPRNIKVHCKALSWKSNTEYTWI